MYSYYQTRLKGYFTHTKYIYRLNLHADGFGATDVYSVDKQVCVLSWLVSGRQTIWQHHKQSFIYLYCTVGAAEVSVVRWQKTMAN